MTLQKTKILGVGITNAKKEEILEFVVKNLDKKRKILKIFTPNPEMIVRASRQKSFKTLLNSADLALNDGVGLSWAAKILGLQLQDRIAGVDFVKMLCSEVAERAVTVGFLGGRGGVAEETAKCLVRENPSLKVVFAEEAWDSGLLRSPDLDKKDARSAFSCSLSSRLPASLPIDILFVAFGFPKQEEWIAEHEKDSIYRVAVGVGGSFDYISGKVMRAPFWIRKLGFEWLFRLAVQPWRIKRQLALLSFVGLVFQKKLKK